MKEKSNAATSLRPEGERVLYAPMLEMDLNKYIVQIKKETTWIDGDKNAITVFKSDYMRIILIGLKKNAELKTHNTKFTISVQVLEGAIEFSVGTKRFELGRGQMIALQPKIPHSVHADVESFFLLTMVKSS